MKDYLRKTSYSILIVMNLLTTIVGVSPQVVYATDEKVSTSETSTVNSEWENEEVEMEEAEPEQEMDHSTDLENPDESENAEDEDLDYSEETEGPKEFEDIQKNQKIPKRKLSMAGLKRIKKNITTKKES